MIFLLQYWHYYAIGFFLTILLVMSMMMPMKIGDWLLVMLSFVVLTLFAGLRGYNAVDYGAYNWMFVTVPDIFDAAIFGVRANYELIEKEPLYLALNTIVKTFSPYSWPVFLITALVAVGANLYFFYKASPFPLLSTLWYYSHLYLNKEMVQIRAGLGSALVLLSSIFIVRGRWLAFLATIITASMFHAGAIVALPMYFFCRKEYSRMTLIIITVLGGVLGAFGWLDPFLSVLKGFSLLPSRVESYAMSDVHGSNLGLLNPLTIKQVLTCILAVYYKDKLKKISPYSNVLLVMYIFSTFWITAFQSFAILAARVATFLSVGDPVIIALLVQIFKEKKMAIVLLAVCSWIVLYLNINIIHRCPEYTFIFDYY